MRFKLEDVPAFYQGYIKQVEGSELLPSLADSLALVVDVCQHLDETQALFRYAEDKWSIKDLMLHLMDWERVFAYRAMRFGRNDQTELSGFDQDDYVRDAMADKFALSDLLTQLKNMRQTTIDLFTAFSETELERSGKSNGVRMTVEMIGYIICGHTYHHTKVIQEGYLV